MSLWLRWTGGNYIGKDKQYNFDDVPSPSIAVGGIGARAFNQYEIFDDGKPMTEQKITKPPYKVPPWVETVKTAKTQYKVIETFAGGGGSDTGWEQAGFKVVWANEFVPSAQDTYLANHKKTILDCRPIQQVTAEDILKETGLKVGELDVFSGSPPCQAFSMAGKREKGWGQGKTYAENKVTQNNEDLFFEFIRLLKGLQPKVFVAENVKGLTIGAAKAMMGDAQLDAFKAQDDTILHGLMDAGYQVRWKVLDAARFGVPQTRNRVFFVGVRHDLVHLVDLDAFWPKPLPYVYTVRDALPELHAAFSQPHGEWPRTVKLDESSPTIPTSCSKGSFSGHQVAGPEPKVIHDTRGRFNSQGDVTDKPVPTILGDKNRGDIKIVQQQGGGFSEKREIDQDRPVPAVCATQHSQFMLEVKKADAGDVAPSREAGKYGHHEVDLDKPAPTVTVASPGNGGAAMSLPGDATVTVQSENRRKFTIPEVKRLCAFPDDYVLIGSYSKQWAVCGNSVPPLMMKALGEAVRDNLLAKIEKPKWGEDDRPPGHALHKQMKNAFMPKAAKETVPKPKKTETDPETAKETPPKPEPKVAIPKGEFKYADYWKERLKK